MKKKTIAITLGDPGGIGTEVTVRALEKFKVLSGGRHVRFLLIGSYDVLMHSAKRLKSRLRFVQAAFPFRAPEAESQNDALPVFEPRLKPAGGRKPHFTLGKVSKLNGWMALESINQGIDFCMKEAAHALVTAPVNKAAIQTILPGFDGHTDYLRIKTHSSRAAMMFIAGNLKMTLVTMHLALNEVSSALSRGTIIQKIELTHWALSHLFGIRNPRIGVAALNPHGSEFGREEERIILPAVRASRKKYGAISGPIPGDEIFRELREGKWDAVIAMYHDQGLAPFKMVAFDRAVNVTVGLPFIRTSPDHGTAFDIAGKCKADERPMLAAIRLACDLCLKKMNS